MSFRNLERILCILKGKARRWYRDSLSGFLTDEIQKELHEHDTFEMVNHVPQPVPVPILKVENFGDDMAIDEKNIGEEMHTVISNRKTGKIALLAQTLKSRTLGDILKKVPATIRMNVDSFTRDMAEGYNWLVRQWFMNAYHIADKFHVLIHLFEAVQAVRIRYRQEILQKERKKKDEHKEKERKRRKECKLFGKPFKAKKFETQSKKLENGDTRLELLARSRYLLFKFSHQWTERQLERATVLFREYPEIQKAYWLACKFRAWYRRRKKFPKHIRYEKILSLHMWTVLVEESDISEMLDFAYLVEKHEGEILNYFREGKTNANAESLNAQIQRFIRSNGGTRDKWFFYFRMIKYFT